MRFSAPIRSEIILPINVFLEGHPTQITDFQPPKRQAKIKIPCLQVLSETIQLYKYDQNAILAISAMQIWPYCLA